MRRSVSGVDVRAGSTTCGAGPSAPRCRGDRLGAMRARGLVPWIALLLGACGAGGGEMTGDDGDIAPCEPGACEVDSLDSEDGCAGVYNPEQILDLHLTTSHWSSVKADADGTTYYPAQFSCGDEAPLPF